MKPKFIYLISFAILFAAISACSPIFSSLYGIKKPKRLNDDQIREYAEKLKLPASDVYRLDTSYMSFILTLDTVKFKPERKNHYQPLQAMYFDRQGNLISFYVNCYAGGFPNLKWNREGSFDVFPPKTQAPLDDILPYGKLSGYLTPLGSSATPDASDYDYIVVIFWNRFMLRQSKRLINVIRENCRLGRKYHVKIIYVNDDNLFAEG